MEFCKQLRQITVITPQGLLESSGMIRVACAQGAMKGSPFAAEQIQSTRQRHGGY
jgi:hypothetical protein